MMTDCENVSITWFGSVLKSFRKLIVFILLSFLFWIVQRPTFNVVGIKDEVCAFINRLIIPQCASVWIREKNLLFAKEIIRGNNKTTMRFCSWTCAQCKQSNHIKKVLIISGWGVCRWWMNFFITNKG